jgi:polyphenol oxidase
VVLAWSSLARYRYWVTFLTSPLLTSLGFRHAFFTRAGGSSRGPYESLNFSYAVGDDPLKVDANFRSAEGALGLGPGQLSFLSQVHGNRVVELTSGSTREQTKHIEADGAVANDPTLGVGVRTADCLPVLLADPETGRVGAVHAGWRGLVLGVLFEGVRALGFPQRLHVAIGPHIGVRAFEVSADVAEQLTTCSNADPVLLGFGPKPHVDLAAIAIAQLRQAGVDTSHIDRVPGCTYDEPASFYSFRRDGKVGGRHLSAIVARG